jgi:hypothetical protein
MRWLARRLRPSRSKPMAPKAAATGSKLSAYCAHTEGGGGLVGVIWKGRAAEHLYEEA